MLVTKTLHCILGLCLPLSLALGCSKENTEANEPEVVVTEESPEPVPTPVPPPKPKPAPEPEPAGAAVLKAAIAAVQLNQDCPDPVRASATIPKRSPGVTLPRRDEKRARAKRSLSGRGYSTPCRQSSMQLSFAGQDQDTTIEIVSIRLVSAEGKDLGPLKARHPTMFSNAGYSEWNQIIPANKELKASYKLSVPDWAELGSSSGIQFKLELEILANGKTLKLLSPSFGRTRPQMIRT